MMMQILYNWKEDNYTASPDLAKKVLVETSINSWHESFATKTFAIDYIKFTYDSFN